MNDPKPHPNEDRYRDLMRRLTTAQRVDKAMELCQVSRELFFAALRRKHPTASDTEIRQIAIKQLYG